MKKIALFGGTFDPIHFGHINLAIEVLEQERFDEVWWIPTNIQPLRRTEAASAQHRLEMVKLATAAVPQFVVLDIEIKKGGPSYTIDTLREIVDGKNSFTLVVADDAFAFFSQWKEPKKIEELVQILIVKRQHKGLEIPKMEISSTRVRERLKKNLYCGHLVPANVLDYIYENQLYSNP